MSKIALIGECMIELNGTPFGTITQTFGGDSLNTALYLARLEPSFGVQYVTALGTDPLSEGMNTRWQQEGIDTRFVLRDKAHQPGLYLIQLDEKGERTFLYWRNDSAARYLVQHHAFSRCIEELAKCQMVYLSGISLAILPESDRTLLVETLRQLANQGVAIAFDSNYRPALWKNTDQARECYRSLLSFCDLALVTDDDEHALWGNESAAQILARLHQVGCKHVVLKQGGAGCIFSDGLSQQFVATNKIATPVDTTAAGDSFNAGFLQGWLRGDTPEQCCRSGHALAAVVISHRGAIIPKEKMQHLCHNDF